MLEDLPRDHVRYLNNCSVLPVIRAWAYILEARPPLGFEPLANMRPQFVDDPTFCRWQIDEKHLIRNDAVRTAGDQGEDSFPKTVGATYTLSVLRVPSRFVHDVNVGMEWHAMNRFVEPIVDDC